MNRLLLLATLALAGCLSPGVSSPSTTWQLHGATKASPVRVKVVLPSALRRPTLVTYDGVALNHDLDRWGEPLDEAIAGAVAADLADLPLTEVFIDVQRLEVTTGGQVTLIFTAQLTLAQAPAGAPLPVRSEPIIFTVQFDDKGCARPDLAAAFGAYGFVHNRISLAIREALDKEQGGVAKPAPGVTVPGK